MRDLTIKNTGFHQQTSSYKRCVLRWWIVHDMEAGFCSSPDVLTRDFWRPFFELSNPQKDKKQLCITLFQWHFYCSILFGCAIVEKTYRNVLILISLSFVYRHLDLMGDSWVTNTIPYTYFRNGTKRNRTLGGQTWPIGVCCIETCTGWAPPVLSWFINHYNPH